jgi:hypothetical protein
MFHFAPQVFRHNKITMDTIDTKDILSFHPPPAVYPQRRFGIVFAYFIFRNNDITIRNHKLNNDVIQDTSPEYSDSTFSDTRADGFKDSTHGRLMLEGQSHDEKLAQLPANIPEARVKINGQAV